MLCPCRKSTSTAGSNLVEAAAPPPVVLYNDQNFKGQAFPLTKEGVYNWCKGDHSELKIGNDAIRSVKVAPGWKVTLWLHCAPDKPYGDTLTLYCDTGALGTMDKNASGVTVEKLGPVVLYTGQNLTGIGYSLDKEGVYNYCKDTLVLGNDKVRSVLVTLGWKVTLHKDCSKTGVSGQTMVLTTTAGKLDSMDLQTSAVTVEKIPLTGLVVVYPEPDYKGVPQVFNKPGVYNWCKKEMELIGNDKIQSVKLHPGYKVTLHMHCDAVKGPYGDKLELFSNTPRLPAPLNKNASGVTVEKLGPIVLYTGQHYTGKVQSITKEGVYNFCQGLLPIGNNTIRSVIVDNGWKAVLHRACSAKGPCGPHVEFVQSHPTLGAFDKAVSVVTAEKIPAPVVVYSGQRYTGESKEFRTEGLFNWCKDKAAFGKIGNDQIRSVKVARGWKVTLHHDCDATKGGLGVVQVLTANAEVLTAQLDKATSAITIEAIAPVVLYPEVGFKGAPQVLNTVGTFDYCKFQLNNIGNDHTRSVKVAAGWKVTLHKDCGAKGASAVLEANSAQLPAALDKAASSVTVERLGLVVLYSEQNYQGETQVINKLGLSNWCTGGLPIGNDVVRSVKVSPGVKVTLHQDCSANGPSGNTLVLTASKPILVDNAAKPPINLDKKTSAVTVGLQGLAVLYDGQNYTGKFVVVPKEGQWNICSNQLPPITNDTIRSALVAPDYKLSLFHDCTGGQPTGAVEVIYAEAPTLSAQLDKATSFVKLEKIVPCIVYAGQNFTGVSQTLGAVGVYNWCIGQLNTIGNDKIRSVRVGHGYRVTLHKHCEQKGPYGETQVLNGDAPTLGPVLDHEASGVTVARA